METAARGHGPHRAVSESPRSGEPRPEHAWALGTSSRGDSRIAEYRFELDQLQDRGHKVVAIARQSGGSKQSGVLVDMRMGHVLTFTDGKLVRNETYASPDEALEAAGLSKSATSQDVG